MFNPLEWSKPGYLESDKAEYFLFMQNEDRKQKINDAIGKFRCLKDQGYDINECIDDVLESYHLDNVTNSEAKYIMEQVDRW